MAYRRYKPRYRGSSFKGRGRYRKAGFYGRYKPCMRGGHIVVERKFLDSESDNAAIAETAESQGVSMLTVVQEVGPSSRNGRKIVVTAINVRCIFTWYVEYDGDTATSSTQTDNNEVRMLIVIDKQSNGAIAAFGDIIALPTITNPLTAYNNLANKGRFITLVDKTFLFHKNVEKGSSTDIIVMRKRFNYYKKCRIPILYSGSSGAITERCCNNIVCYVVALRHDTTTPNVNHVTLQMSNRVRFMDI